MPQELEKGRERGIPPHHYVVDGHQDRPRSGINQEESDFQDSSRQLFSMYIEIGEEQDNKTAERWKADAEVILIFVSPLCHHS